MGILSIAAVALVFAAVAPARAQEDLPVLARVGPWPVVSSMVGFGGRLWFVNSVKGRNHNAADIHSYDPRTGALRYERNMFSQDSGAPLVAGGRLFWPFEDSRFSLSWGNFLVTDGTRWRLGTIPTTDIYHTHAMAELGARLVAATSAWRAGLQVSQDGGRSWREVYDHPTPDGRVSRIVDLVTVGELVFGSLRSAGERRLVRFDGVSVEDVPGWPKDRATLALVASRGWLYGLVREPDGAGGVALWRSDGVSGDRVAGPWQGWRPFDLAAGDGKLWAVGADQSGGAVWGSEDGVNWRPYRRLAGGTPHEIAVFGGEVYVAGAGADGQGILWGPPPPAVPTAPPPAELGDVVPRSPVGSDWDAAAAALDLALQDPDSYVHHAGRLRDLVYEFARARPPADFFAKRLARPLPEDTVSLIGGQVSMPAAALARWVLLWAMGVAGDGRVPLALIAEPWTAPANASEKYFRAPTIALWSAAMIGQRDRATIATMIGRLNAADDPLWLRGDVVGALTTLTGERFGYDVDAWRGWWRNAVGTWPE